MGQGHLEHILPFVDGGGKDMANLRRYYGQDFCFDKRSGNGYPNVVFAILIFSFIFASIEDLIMDISILR